jgi:2,4-dienoyl-CoA reductase-like NADH-dependent reductase (Old Yellow Enzyme family)
VLVAIVVVSFRDRCMPSLFQPIDLRSLTLANRIVVSPMCQYSSLDGFATDWHLVHLGSRAVGGAGLVFTEAAAVTAEGRISPQDLGVWKDDHIAALRRITAFLHSQGSAAGIQLAHAGRKASTAAPWLGEGAVTPPEGGWEPVGPTTEAFTDTYPVPRALTVAEINSVVRDFEAAARRALDAGFDVVEIHAAHGYLLHQFLSPLVNTRHDDYGGAFENRIRLTFDVADAVRRLWPAALPVFVRISATDWVDGGWDLDQSVELARRLKTIGIDLIDCSSGGAVRGARIATGPGYQVPFAERIRGDAGIATGAVGMITTAAQADAIIRDGQADVVLLAREMLRDPYFALHAVEELGGRASWPVQYLRAAPPGSQPRSGR